MPSHLRARPDAAGVTRADIARHAGVSGAVVSYVLNNGPRPVSAATRTRVLAAVGELGYRPNAVARALKLRRTHSLGLVVPDNSNPYFAELAKALEDAAFARGYALVLANSSGDPGREAAQLRALLDRQVDGLIVISVSAALDAEPLGGASVPLVLLDRAASEARYPTVVVDSQGGARAGTQHLMKHGHRLIGCIAGPEGLPSAAARRAGWRDAMVAAGPVPENLATAAPFSRAGGYVAARRLLVTRTRPTALFASSDVQAVGALHAVHELGLRVPEDLALVSFDGTEEAEFATPPLTVVQQPVRHIADAVLDLLACRPGHPAGHVMLDYELIARQSCGCRGTPPDTPLLSAKR